MNRIQCREMARIYREKAAYIRKEGILRWPGDFNQLFIWQSEERVLLAHAEAYEAAFHGAPAS